LAVVDDWSTVLGASRIDSNLHSGSSFASQSGFSFPPIGTTSVQAHWVASASRILA